MKKLISLVLATLTAASPTIVLAEDESQAEQSPQEQFMAWVVETQDTAQDVLEKKLRKYAEGKDPEKLEKTYSNLANKLDRAAKAYLETCLSDLGSDIASRSSSDSLITNSDVKKIKATKSCQLAHKALGFWDAVDTVRAVNNFYRIDILFPSFNFFNGKYYYDGETFPRPPVITLASVDTSINRHQNTRICWTRPLDHLDSISAQTVAQFKETERITDVMPSFPTDEYDQKKSLAQSSAFQEGLWDPITLDRPTIYEGELPDFDYEKYNKLNCQEDTRNEDECNRIEEEHRDAVDAISHEDPGVDWETLKQESWFEEVSLPRYSEPYLDTYSYFQLVRMPADYSAKRQYYQYQDNPEWYNNILLLFCKDDFGGGEI